MAALDASTRLQVIDLLLQLQKERGLSLLFITHDLAVVARIAHRVAVMRFGRILETGPTHQVLSAPQHPYTQRLIAAMPGAQQTATLPPMTSDPGPYKHRQGPALKTAPNRPFK